MSQPLVRFKRAALGYGRKTVVEGVDLEIRQGEAWGVVGPNGAGKTTLLKTLLGLETPLRGEISAHGSAFGKPRFGYVPQKERLDAVFPLTAFAVAEMGTYRSVELFRRARGIDHGALVRECLKACGVQDLAKRFYSELSGGQRQRVLIARALAAEPELLVLDEPFVGIDSHAHAAVLALLKQLRSEREMTMVIVGHRMGGAGSLFTHMAWINGGRAESGPAPKMLAHAGVADALREGRE